MSKVDVLGIKFDNQTMSEFQNTIIERMNNHLPSFIVTANPEIVMAARENSEFATIINQADLVTADGIGIVKGATMLKTPIKERVTGYDLFTWLLSVANSRHQKVYFIGAKPEVIADLKEKVTNDLPNIEIVGARDGYFKEDLTDIAQEIIATNPDMVFAAIGYPRQEILLDQIRQSGIPAVLMGVGGSFDVFSGHVARAPEAFQKLHLEWFYRLLKNPSRFKRMLVLPKYLMEVRKVGKNK